MKIDNYDQRWFLIRFLEISGLKKAEIDVSTSYLLQASPGVKIKRSDMLTHVFFLCKEWREVTTSHCMEAKFLNLNKPFSRRCGGHANQRARINLL